MTSPYVSVSCSYTENSTDIVNNRSNVTVKLNFASVDGGYANDSPNYWLKVWGPDGTEIGSLSGTQNFSAGQSFTLCTWTGNVTHDENGNGNIQYQGYFQGAAKPDPGVTTQKYTQPLTSLPRASELTNGTVPRAIDGTMSFGVNKKIDTATDKLTLKSGTVSSVVSTNYVTGTTFSLSTATVNSLEKLNTSGTSVPMVAQIETIVSGTTIGTNTYAFTGTFTAPTPTWTSPSVGSYSITGVQNHNTVTVKYGGTISGVNNASIKSIKYTIGTQVSTVTTISNSASFTNISVKDVTIQAFDGRGASVISTFVNAISTMSSYTEPTFDIDSVRRNPTMLDTGAVIEFSGTKNTYETTNISGYYKQGGSSATTAISAGYINKSGVGTGTTSYTGTVTFPTGKFDIDKDYIVTLIANDQYTTQNKEVTITKANVAMDIDLTNNRVAVGQLVPTSTSGTGSVPSNSLAVYGKIFTGGNEVAGFEEVASASTPGIALAGTSVTTTGDANIGGDIYESSIKLSSKYLFQPTEYISNLTWTDWQNSKILTWTVSGNGFVFVSISTQANDNSDTGTAYAIIELNNVYVAVECNRLAVAATVKNAACASAMFAVSNGDVIKTTLNNSKGSTLSGYRRALAFGCTLTSS